MRDPGNEIDSTDQQQTGVADILFPRTLSFQSNEVGLKALGTRLERVFGSSHLTLTAI